MTSKGVRSIRSTVMNLRELAKDCDFTVLAEAVATAFRDEHGLPSQLAMQKLDPLSPALHESLSVQLQAMGSWEWIFGQSPPFSVTKELLLPSNSVVRFLCKLEWRLGAYF